MPTEKPLSRVPADKARRKETQIRNVAGRAALICRMNWLAESDYIGYRVGVLGKDFAHLGRDCSVALLLGLLVLAPTATTLAEPTPTTTSPKAVTAEEDSAEARRRTGVRKYSNVVLKKGRRYPTTTVFKKEMDVGTPARATVNVKFKEASRPSLKTKPVPSARSIETSTSPGSKKSKPVILKSKKVLQN